MESEPVTVVEIVENGVSEVIGDDAPEKEQDNVVRMIQEESDKKFQEEEPVIVQDDVEDVPPKITDDEEKVAPVAPVINGPRKAPLCTSIDTETIRAAYDDVRDDNSDVHWAVFKFEGSRISCSSKGVDFEEFRQQFGDNERAFGYIRIQAGDEMSKRQKFLFVTWVGPEVSVLQRAKMSTDKAVIKNIISNFAVELQLESISDFDLSFFIESLNKASGANYGTGIREI